MAPAVASAENGEERVVDEFAEARATGELVEIASQRSTTDTVFATPAGTIVRETASAPIRVHSEDGWEKIDLALEEVDGVLRPKAAVGLLELSAGGDGPLVTIGQGTTKTSLTWPSALPAPVLDGSSATYEDVLPDVDLRMTVTDGGVAQVLVVHTEEAAQDPALASIDIATEVEGGVLEPKSGGYVVKDDAGRVVGVSPEPVMWDSNGTLRDDDHQVIPDASVAAVEQRTQGPAAGDAISPIQLQVDDRSLTLEPDQEALTGQEVSYPVYIDPVAIDDEPNKWAMVFKQHPDMSFYNWKDSEGQGVGHQSGYGMGTSTKRLFFQHSMSSVSGHQIIDATFKARMNWSASCTERAVKVYRVSAVTSDRTWNNQPSWGAYQDSKSYSAGRSDCNPAGRDVVWDVTPGVTDAAAERRTEIAFGLRVSDESDPLTWRRFRNTTVLRVEYNKLPYRPSSLTIGGKPCVQSAVTVLRAQTSAPAMSALVSDPDGQNVRGRFRWNAGSTVSSSSPERLSAFVTKGSRTSTALPVAPVNGTMPSGTWSFRVVAEDTLNAKGSPSEECTFTIDSTPASEPQIRKYPGENDPDDRWVSGTPRSVELWPAEGQAADTSGYAYTVDSDQAPATKTHTPSATTKVMSLTLPTSGQPALQPGLHVLRVWAFDSAGNRSATPAMLDFEVFDGAASSRSTYRFEGADSVAGNDLTGPFPMSLGTAARVNRIFVSDGVDVYAQDRMLSLSPMTTTLPSVTADLVAMSRSFSIAGFFDPAGLESPQPMTAVTVRGGSGAKFAELGVEPAGEGYDYVFKLWDATSQSWTIARLGGEDAYLGTTLVVASYDPVSKTLNLSMPDHGTESAVTVDGDPPATLSGQQLRLGASTTEGSRWTGGLDNLVVARGSLTSAEVADLVKRHETPECFETEGGCE